MKSRARYRVYLERAHLTHNPALEHVAELESEIMHEAERSWRSAMSFWRKAQLDPMALFVMLRRAKERAQREVCVAFDDQITTESLAKFFESFKPEDLIPSEGAS